MSWQDDKNWSDRFIPSIRAIVGPHLLVPSSLEVDTQQAADLVVLKARDMTLACRIRKYKYLELYPHQFTIRAERDSGSKTELAKITEGWADWMFYGFAVPTEHPYIAAWSLIDLHAFRCHLIRDKSSIIRGMTANGDGTHFAWFDIDSFPPLPPLCIDRNGFNHPRTGLNVHSSPRPGVNGPGRTPPDNRVPQYEHQTA